MRGRGQKKKSLGLKKSWSVRGFSFREPTCGLTDGTPGGRTLFDADHKTATTAVNKAFDTL